MFAISARSGSAMIIRSVISSASAPAAAARRRASLAIVRGSSAVEQVARRQIDRDRHVAPVAAPGGAVGDRALEHAPAERPDQLGLLDGRHECPGGISPRSGCCQRTSASAPRIERSDDRHDRLVVDDDLVVGQRPAEVREHAQAQQRVLVLLGAVELVVGLRLLGRVHGRCRRSASARWRRAPSSGKRAAPMLAPMLERQLVERERRVDARR